jgi:hypothetical protein
MLVNGHYVNILYYCHLEICNTICTRFPEENVCVCLRVSVCVCVFATQYLSIVASLCVPLTLLSESQWVFGCVYCSHGISLLYACGPFFSITV